VLDHDILGNYRLFETCHFHEGFKENISFPAASQDRVQKMKHSLWGALIQL